MKKPFIYNPNKGERTLPDNYHSSILRELSIIKEQNNNINIDLYHLRLDIFKIVTLLSQINTKVCITDIKKNRNII